MTTTLALPERLEDSRILELSWRNPGCRFERDVEGRLMVSRTACDAGRRSSELNRQLANRSADAGLGVTFDSSTGFRMPDGSLLSPDAAWIAERRWDALSASERTGYAPLCPDAIFEIASRERRPQ